jgi:hypothetical protein
MSHHDRKNNQIMLVCRSKRKIRDYKPGETAKGKAIADLVEEADICYDILHQIHQLRVARRGTTEVHNKDFH